MIVLARPNHQGHEVTVDRSLLRGTAAGERFEAIAYSRGCHLVTGQIRKYRTRASPGLSERVGNLVVRIVIAIIIDKDLRIRIPRVRVVARDLEDVRAGCSAGVEGWRWELTLHILAHLGADDLVAGSGKQPSFQIATLVLQADIAGAQVYHVEMNEDAR